jgi:hypothetical protein
MGGSGSGSWNWSWQQLGWGNKRRSFGEFLAPYDN